MSFGVLELRSEAQLQSVLRTGRRTDGGGALSPSG